MATNPPQQQPSTPVGSAVEVVFDGRRLTADTAEGLLGMLIEGYEQGSAEQRAQGRIHLAQRARSEVQALLNAGDLFDNNSDAEVRVLTERDVLVAPSDWHSATPLVLVASSYRPAGDAAQPGVSGLGQVWWVDPTTPETLLETLHRLRWLDVVAFGPSASAARSTYPNLGTNGAAGYWWRDVPKAAFRDGGAVSGRGLSLPTDAEILALHKELAPSGEAFDLVYTHSQIVCAVAEQVLRSRSLDLDAALVRAGSLLHDIGVYRLFTADGGMDAANYVRHGILGFETLQELGFPEVLCRFCSCHTGVGLSRDDVVRQGLPIPVDDYLAVSGEEELVMYADKFHSKTSPPVFVRAGTYTGIVRRYGEDKAATFASMVQRYGEPDLAPLTAAYGHSAI